MRTRSARTARIAATGLAALAAVAGLSAPAQARASSADERAAAVATGWRTLPSPPVKARSAIPWKQVGPGWVVLGVAHDEARAMRTSVMLYSPTGQGYRVKELPGLVFVGDVRPDGRAAVLLDLTTGRSRVIDLATGRLHTTFDATRHSLLFIGRTGDLLDSVGDGRGTQVRVRRISADGRVRLSRSTNLAVVDTSADGRHAVARRDDGKAVHVDPATLRQRVYPRPRGSGYCVPREMWDASSFSMTCTTKRATAQVFTQPVAGGAARQRTWGTAAGRAQGFDEAWPTSTGTVAGSGEASGAPVLVPYRFGGRLGRTPIRVQVPLPRDYQGSDARLGYALGSRLYFAGISDTIGSGVIVADTAARTVTALSGWGTSMPGIVVGPSWIARY